MDWKNREVLVTGGASCIGSHAKIINHPEMPTGPLNRVADYSRITER